MSAEPARGAEGRDHAGPALTEEIARYENILAQDSKSRSFALLAEAYRKNGQLDEAVKTAQEGLAHHPYYLSGRVALARAHYDGRRFDLARQEFEKVIAAAPDNLMAHRHLAEIYAEEGKLTDAAKSLKMVLLLDPGDERAKERMEGISRKQQHGAAQAPSAAEGLIERHRFEEESAAARGGPPPGFESTQIAEPAPPRGTSAAPPPPAPAASRPATPAPSPPSLKPRPEAPPPPAAPTAARAPAAPSPPSLKPRVPAPPLPPTPPPAAPVPEPVAAGEQEEPFFEFTLEDEPPPVAPPRPSVPPAPPAPPVPPPAPRVVEPAVATPPPAPRQAGGWDEVMDEVHTPEPPEELSTETLAGIYVQQGFHDKALDIYRRLLEERPGDPRLARKTAEIERLMGKPAAGGPRGPSPEAPVPGGRSRDDEAVAVLRTWLERVKERRR